MKKLLLILFIAAIKCSTISAQKITTDKVPVLISRAFNSKFPAGTQQSWSWESDSIYQVEFFNDRKREAATFDITGSWLATETETTLNKLPGAVNSAFNKQFPGYKVQESTQLETADKGTLYNLVVIKGNDGYELQFSAKGQLIKKEAASAAE